MVVAGSYHAKGGVGEREEEINEGYKEERCATLKNVCSAALCTPLCLRMNPQGSIFSGIYTTVV